MWLISSELVKWSKATLTETEKLSNDIYIIRISFDKLRNQQFEKVL